VTNGKATVTLYDSYPGRGKPLTASFHHRAVHQGLFRTAALRWVGGYDGGFRIAYNMLLTNLLVMTGQLAYVDEPLYHWCARPTSLTAHPATGFGSPARLAAGQRLRQLYRQAFGYYTGAQANAFDGETLAGLIRQRVAANVSDTDRLALAFETERLRVVLSARIE
jgi:hypothetical protein